MASGDKQESRSRPEGADLRAAWVDHAAEWIAWVRTPGHDSYGFHRDLFLPLLPAPGLKILDVGCGEGRLSNDLARLGHRVVGVDRSPRLVGAARSSYPAIEFQEADAAALPFADATFDCVVAFMSLQDTDDLDPAIRECARVLKSGGRFCFAVVHPMKSIGWFDSREPDARFVIEGSYLDDSFYEDSVARDGLTMTFLGKHRPLHRYTDALAEAGLLIERIGEPAVPEGAIHADRSRRWQRIPLFLHCRAVKSD